MILRSHLLRVFAENPKETASARPLELASVHLGPSLGLEHLQHFARNWSISQHIAHIEECILDESNYLKLPSEINCKGSKVVFPFLGLNQFSG
jgi:hypothetical protein